MFGRACLFSNRLRIFALAFVVLTLSPCAEAAPERGKAFDDWIIACSGASSRDEKCVASQTQTMKGSGQRLLRFSAGYLGPKGEPTAVALLPLGIYLPAGAVFKVDNNPDVRMTIQSCTPDGCTASLPLNAPTLKMLHDGKVMIVAVMSSEANKQLTIPVSLKGFAPAFDSLK